MSNFAVVVAIDGILMRKVSSAPIPLGLQLYHGLASAFTVLLASDQDKEKTDYWLKLEGLNKHSGVSYNEGALLEHSYTPDRRTRQIQDLRSRGYSIALAFDPDPAVCLRLISLGFSVCNFIDSAYADPEWRPDFEWKVKPWDELKKEAERLAALRAEDHRVDPERPMVG